MHALNTDENVDVVDVGHEQSVSTASEKGSILEGKNVIHNASRLDEYFSSDCVDTRPVIYDRLHR